MTALTDEQLADLRRFVKPLEWECVDWSSGDGIEGENDCCWVSDAAGWRRGVQYQIDWFGADDFRVECPDGIRWPSRSLTEAKAAAQTDYADMILSAAPDLLAEVVRLRLKIEQLEYDLAGGQP